MPFGLPEAGDKSRKTLPASGISAIWAPSELLTVESKIPFGMIIFKSTSPPLRLDASTENLYLAIGVKINLIQ